MKLKEIDMELWVVGISISENDWTIQGVFDSEEKAVSLCVNEDQFVGPMTLNEDYGLEDVGWPDAYYPISMMKQIKEATE